MSYSGFKEDLLESIEVTHGVQQHIGKVFIFTSRDIYDLYDGCEYLGDASDALRSLWQYDGELARIEVSKIDKSLIADRESVPSKGYFYALARHAPPGFEMHEKFKLDKKEIKPEINIVLKEQEMIDTNNKETEMDEKEYLLEVWNREAECAADDLYKALNNPYFELSIDAFEDVEEYMIKIRELQDKRAARYRMAKKQLEALK